MRIDQLNGYDEELVDLDDEMEEELQGEDPSSAQDEYGAEWQDDAALDDGASDGLMDGTDGGQSVHDGNEPHSSQSSQSPETPPPSKGFPQSWHPFPGVPSFLRIPAA